MDDLRRGIVLLTLICAELGGLTAGGTYFGFWLSQSMGWSRYAALPFALLGFSIGIYLVLRTAIPKGSKK